MLKINEIEVGADSARFLDLQSAKIREIQSFIDRVALAKALWKGKVNTRSGNVTFSEVRERLAENCRGIVRCAYCEDSAADEIEHVAPKTVFPLMTFDHRNFLFCCGPCNGPKSNRFAQLVGEAVVEVSSKDLTSEPEWGDALINPLVDDPMDFIRLDMGGERPGLTLVGTFNFIPNFGMSALDTARADWTISLLDLNREVLRKGRETAFTLYRAALHRYNEVARGESDHNRDRCKEHILRAPHPTVLFELIRQRRLFPDVARVVESAPEIAEWDR